MKECTHYIVRPNASARTPRHLGLNVEVQDNHERTNLWDWLAHTGSTVVREFHPEQTLRKSEPAVGTWGRIESKADYDGYRSRVTSGPDGDVVDWSNYKFEESVPWMGVPDGIASKVTEAGMVPLYSLGYGPKLFGKPLVLDGALREEPGDDGVDWEAAVSAYEYFFAVMWRYASRFGGRYFMMCNEPEHRRHWFYLPDDLAEMGWGELFWHAEESLLERYYGILGAQYAVMCRVARDAIEDVRGLLRARGASDADALHLSGPTTVVWRSMWPYCAKYLDSLDIHHYHSEPRTFSGMLDAAAAEAAKGGKSLAMSEFNQYSGGIDFRHVLFATDEALAMAKLLLTVLSANRLDDPAFEFATLYVFHFPSTHRNYKHLVYGDMNMVDWSGADTPLWNRGKEGRSFGSEAWYPTFEEMQIRHATPGYHIFRMLMRNVRTAEGGCGPHEVLPVGAVNPTSSGPRDVHEQLEVVAVRQPGRLVLNVLNQSDRAAKECRLDLSALSAAGEAAWYASAVVRLTDRTRADVLVSVQTDLSSGIVSFDVPGESFVQVMLTGVAVDRIASLRLEERTVTPGGCEGLGMLETTRLRALAEVEGSTVDVSELCVRWSSDGPDVVRVDQGGLVQRIREAAGDEAVRIEAAVGLPGGVKAEVVVRRGG